MCEEAEAIETDSIVNIRYTSSDVMSNSVEVIAYKMVNK